MECKIEIKAIENRKRLQYFSVPFACILFYVVMLIIFSMSSDLSHNHTELLTAQSHQAHMLGAITPLQISMIITLIYTIVLFSLPLVIIKLAQGFIAGLVIVITNKYPNWIYQWNKGVINYYVNFLAYNWLIIDKFPNVSNEDTQVLMEVPTPNKLSRWKPLFKWLLALPQLIISYIIYFLFCLLHSVILWPYLVITGKSYPKKLQALVARYIEWQLSIFSYSTLLFTDTYPKFIFKFK